MTAVREAREDDLSAIGALHVAAIEAFGPDAYDEREVAAWVRIDDPPAEHYDLTEGYWVVVERDGEIVGFGHLDPDEAEVVAVYVHPDHAGQGVGSALLAGLEGYARGIGLGAVTLVASRNAVGFYERAGYERRERVTHETSAGVELDCVRMGKTL